MSDEEDDKEAQCFNCGKSVDHHDCYCHGCRECVCEDCDKSLGLMGAHDPSDHLHDSLEDEYNDEED